MFNGVLLLLVIMMMASLGFLGMKRCICGWLLKAFLATGWDFWRSEMIPQHLYSTRCNFGLLILSERLYIEFSPVKTVAHTVYV